MMNPFCLLNHLHQTILRMLVFVICNLKNNPHLHIVLIHGVVMTTIFYCSVNNQSGLPKISYSKYACITLIHNNVPQDFRSNLRYIMVL